MGVPHQVVHPVDIEAAVDDACKRVFPGDNGTDLRGVEPRAFQYLCNRSIPEEVIDLVMASAK